ncbi:hypothetical protein PY254_06760 [Rhodanobacter sp. AS-Z3]|uniref:hypothetical protein n=1 Tax=Rhodanobacter sp. AS-Z3 TaxID=3031330 RepID=UPI002478DD6D|nr:hypothetical protein [Rhodanobacter sp. AS-Z3]WEN16363.1 hypothetical protein PY254_06760 [Rhodanobacter sp. AS-Z3]
MNSLDKNRQDENRPDNHLEQRARELWREAAHQIDPVTAGRLRAARREALQSAEKPVRHTVRWLIPSGAFAVIALAALMVWQPLPQQGTQTATQAVSSNIDDADTELPPDADKTDPNLYQNLDFYDWLASTDSTPATH